MPNPQTRNITVAFKPREAIFVTAAAEKVGLRPSPWLRMVALETAKRLLGARLCKELDLRGSAIVAAQAAAKAAKASPNTPIYQSPTGNVWADLSAAEARHDAIGIALAEAEIERINAQFDEKPPGDATNG